MPKFIPELFDMVKYFEGLSLTPYQDKGDVPTIGYGHTGTDVDNWFNIGYCITNNDADTLLLHDLAGAGEQLLFQTINLGELTNNQYSALTSFVFNLGIGSITSNAVIMHGLLKTALLIQSEISWENVANHMEEFSHLGTTKLLGLTRRRKAEALMLLGRDWTEAKEYTP